MSRIVSFIIRDGKMIPWSAMLSCTDRGGAGILAQRGAVRPHERESAEHCRHQARNVEVERIRFRCVLQPRPADGNSGDSTTS